MRQPPILGLVLATAALVVPGASAVTGASTITTVAGNGTAGYSGDDGLATAARLNAPAGVAVDARGNLYIADAGNNRVREVTGGRIVTIAGNGTPGYSGDGGPATTAALHSPHGVAVDGSGNVYIADAGNNRVRKVSGGTITTIAGNGTPGFSGDHGAATAAELDDPNGVAVDRRGDVYIADSINGRVREVASGTITTIAGGGVAGGCTEDGLAVGATLVFPTGVAVDALGNVFVVDNQKHCVLEVIGNEIATIAGIGGLGYSGDLGPATAAKLNFPIGVAVDRQGNVYISDGGNAAVRKVDAAGIISTIAGGLPGGASTGDGGPAIDASLATPQGLAVDPQGNLYIADLVGSIVREIADPLAPGPPPSGGPPAPQAGPGPASPAPAPALRLTLRLAPRQRLLWRHGFAVIATCDEACSLTITGTVRIIRSRRAVALVGMHASLSGAGSRTLVLRLPSATLKRLERAVRRGAGATALVSVRAADESGPVATVKRTLALSGRRRSRFASGS
jgi:sugar lactone lactonase YvrE